ncbi:YgaP-like transmembrane domain [Pseudomonas subflava]|uniref:YgaP-like transmembrane domain n=1 Tax=Pseudomonas subflava TaxID=2952933 RepID=UPI0020793D90|nr:YgaP-like transmembrane domain [Pseudomonas subflava]
MSEQNVNGWERALSLAVGLAGVGNGIKRGGIGGCLEVAVSLLALKRGLTGDCAMKRALAQASERAESMGSRPSRAGSEELGVPGGAYNLSPRDAVAMTDGASRP